LEEAQDLALIGKVRKSRKKEGYEKGQKKKEHSRPLNHGKKDLNYVKCFKHHKFGHYASPCPEKKKGKQ
jgi:hypothetical protein